MLVLGRAHVLPTVPRKLVLPGVPRSRPLARPNIYGCPTACQPRHSEPPPRTTRPPRRGVTCRAGYSSQPTPHPIQRLLQSIRRTQNQAQATLSELPVHNSKFISLLGLFFLLTFINTILDSLGNSLVITATGGGTAVLPFLTVYAVWPASVVFLVVFTLATQRLSRGAMFNMTIGVFLVCFACFGLTCPFHEHLHLADFAERSMLWVPSGMSGAVGMLRNWIYTLFFVLGELWGDVVLSLLFWGLANELTHMSEAPTLYPLFGMGANLGQTVAGRVLSVFSVSTQGTLTHTQQLQVLMALVVAMGAAVLVLHTHITRTFPSTTAVPSPLPASGAAVSPTALAKPNMKREEAEVTSHPAAPSHAGREQEEASTSGREGKGLSLAESLRVLAKSQQIRCLGVMALAQGLTTNLVDIVWKTHLHMLHPDPARYAAYMGDVAMYTGFATGAMMFASPVLFSRWGWRRVAGLTPSFMLAAGLPFFAGCMAFAFVPPGRSSQLFLLKGLVLAGALLQVFSKGAKFSMFKPAEEMVYIGLDAESRTKGKAAIDVVGAQTGKSGGSVLQQVLLVVGGGQLAKSLPLISAVYTAMLLAWSGAVQRLDKLHVVDFSSHKGAPRKDQEAPGKPSSIPCPPYHSREHNGNGPLNMAGAGPASAA